MNTVKLTIHNLKFSFMLAEPPESKEISLIGSEEYNCGITFRSKLMVIINKTIPSDLMFRTVVHEMTHCYIWAYGLMQFENFKEENLCDFMETFGPSIIKDSFYVMTKFSEKETKRGRKK